MTPELCQQLFNRFPWATIKGTDSGEFVPCWCKDGWYQLIYNMLSKIEGVYKAKNIPIQKLRIYEIKEKYGTMQTEVTNCIPEVYSIIEKYEALSEQVCEKCGANGILREINGWLSVRCERCIDGY